MTRTTHVSGYHRGEEWLNWSIFERPASEPNGSRTSSVPTPIALPTVSPNACASSTPPGRKKPAAILMVTRLKQETTDEITGRQTLDRHCRPQDQRQSRGRVLEGPERDRKRPRADAVGHGGFDRHRSPSRQSLVRHSAVRSRPLPPADRRRKNASRFPRGHAHGFLSSAGRLTAAWSVPARVAV